MPTARGFAPVSVTIVANHVGGIGGMEQQLEQLVKGVLVRGIEVTLISRTSDITPRAGLRLVRVPGPTRPFTIAFPWFCIAATILTARHRRGVVHATGAIVGNRVDVATVHLLHAAVDRLSVVRSRRSTLFHRINARAAHRMSFLAERFSYRPSRTQRLVAVSSGSKAEIARFYPAMAGRIDVIPNGIDVHRFRPNAFARMEQRAAWGVSAADLVALFVGGEWQRKGLTVAIRALAGSPGWSLVVVGEGDAIGAQRLARTLGLGARVRFVGRHLEPERCYAAADAFVLPTSYETFSLVTYEAAASGLPLLVTAVSGVVDILVDGVNGFFIDRSPATLATRLRILTDDTKRREMGAEARRAAASAASWPAMCDRYAEMYSQLWTASTTDQP